MSNSRDLHTQTIRGGPEKETAIEALIEEAHSPQDSLPLPPVYTAEQEARLWRKIDIRFMPIVTMMYLCSFLDRGNIGEISHPPEIPDG